MDFAEFLRTFEVRAPNLMWFLGAGCSISAGIPSAKDIIWDCKSRLYCSEQGVSRSRVSDISNPQIQNIIQDHLMSKNIHPQSGSDGDEYTYYFEKAMPSQKDRQEYIKQLVNRASPSYGHLILASLAKVSKAPITWTTNFDKLVENAFFEIYGSTNDLVIADLGEPSKAVQSLDSRSFPLLVKLHGDFHSEHLKNIQPELKQQDQKMRDALYKASSSYGLCVIGYSGRDNSVMDVLEKAAQQNGAFPHGIFWFVRSGSTPPGEVTKLISIANKSGVDANVIEINTFDEVLDGIRRYLGAFPSELENLLAPKSSRKTGAVLVRESKIPPLLRMNAMLVENSPSTCKLVKCEIGGYKAIHQAIEEKNADLIARRIKKGVIVFGSDSEIRRTFGSHNIESISLYAIDPEKLGIPGEEYNLIHEALFKAIQRDSGLDPLVKKNGKYLLSDVNKTPISLFNTQTGSAVSAVRGIVPRTSIEWREGCRVDIDYKFNKLWLLLTPRVLIFTNNEHDEAAINAAKSFVKERTAPRRGSDKKPIGYNIIAASILAGWMSILTQNKSDEVITLSALGLSDGNDPKFIISTAKVLSGKAK